VTVSGVPENIPKGYEDPQMCRQCRGLCCQGHPGVWVDPERFFAAFPQAGAWAQEEFEKNLPGLGLVLRDYSGVKVPAPDRTGKGCFFLGPCGCRLPPRHRPGQCLALVPSLETLIDGEVRCELTPGFGFASVREKWKEYWKKW